VADVHLVVQRQRVITVAPVVADAVPTVRDQRIDLQRAQACRDRKAGLAPAHDEHDRIPIEILGRGLPEIEPVGASEIARIAAARRTQLPDPFLEPLQFLQRREQRPSLQRVAIVGVGSRPQDSAAAALGGLESEDRFDRLGARTRHIAGRRAVAIDTETSRAGVAGVGFELSENGGPAVDRPDAPGQGQHIAPMAIGMKQALEQRAVVSCESLLEPREPMVRDRRDGFRSGQHSPRSDSDRR
jgi:hypothetical protein